VKNAMTKQQIKLHVVNVCAVMALKSKGEDVNILNNKLKHFSVKRNTTFQK
jgi:hypothetical protein